MTAGQKVGAIKGQIGSMKSEHDAERVLEAIRAILDEREIPATPEPVSRPLNTGLDRGSEAED